MFLTLEFLFSVYLCQSRQHVYIVFIKYNLQKFWGGFLFPLSSHYILLMHYLLKQIFHEYELMKDLEVRTSVAFNFCFLSNTILSCLFFFTFIICRKQFPRKSRLKIFKKKTNVLSRNSASNTAITQYLPQ